MNLKRHSPFMMNPTIQAVRAEAEQAREKATAMIALCDRAEYKPHSRFPGCMESAPDGEEARAALANTLNASRPTARQVLAPFDLERIKLEVYPESLDKPLASYGFVTGAGAKEGDHPAGEVFVHCGGEAIMTFHVDGSGWPMYLVLDSSAHDRWIFQAGELRKADPMANPTATLGRCPGTILKLVQSA